MYQLINSQVSRDSPTSSSQKIWNEANILKRNPSKSAFIRGMKIALLNEIPN